MKNKFLNFRTLKRYITLKKSNLFMVLIFLILISIFNFFQPLVIRMITDVGLVKKDIQIVVLYVSILMVLIISNRIINVLFTSVVANIKNDSELEIYKKVIDKLMKIKYQFYLDKNSSEIIEMLVTDIDLILSIIDTNIFFTIGDILKFISGLVGLMIISPLLTVIILLVIPFKYIGAAFFSYLQKKKTKDYIFKLNKFTSFLGEYISGMKEIRIWNIDNEHKKKLLRNENQLLKRKKEFKMIASWDLFFEITLEWVVIGLIYIVGTILLIKNQLTIGGLFAFVSYSSYVTSPIMSILDFKIIFAQISPSLERFSTFMNYEEDVILGDHFVNSGDIYINNLSFSYEENIIFDNVSLVIPKNAKVAIIGDNGSGKSTLLNIILRFIVPQKGSIKISNVDIYGMNIHDYRNLFSVITQNPFVFNTTVEENINLYHSKKHDELAAIYKKCQLLELIKKLPQGDKTVIGINGARLSGGEKQKIAFARIFVKNSPYIILDEPSTGYDSKSRKYLRNIITNDMKNKTVILITHNYKDLDEMDIIYKITNKKIIRIQ